MPGFSSALTATDKESKSSGSNFIAVIGGDGWSLNRPTRDMLEYMPALTAVTLDRSTDRPNEAKVNCLR